MQATQTASAAMLRRRCLPTGPGIRLRRIGFGALLRCRTPPLHRPGAAPGKKRKGRLRCREKPSHQALAAMVERLHDEAPLLPLLRVSASRHHFSAQELRKREALCLCVVSCPKTRLGATPENFGASPQCLSPSRALWTLLGSIVCPQASGSKRTSLIGVACVTVQLRQRKPSKRPGML